MPNKRIRRTILLILLLSLVYNLLRTTNTPWISSQRQTNKNTGENHNITIPVQNITIQFQSSIIQGQLKNATYETIGTHIPMPQHLKGKAMPFHQVFEPRQIGFPKDLLVSHESNKTKTILVWTAWNKVKKTINYYFLRPGRKTFKRHSCPNSNCITTFNRKNLSKADAVLFHLIDTKISDMPLTRAPGQTWIVYNMEPPWQVEKHVSTQMHRLKNIFNWTMGYQKDSDVVVRYGFISRVNNIMQPNITFGAKSKMVVWFVSDCNTDSKREDYVKELKKYIDIDVYGRCGSNKCYPSQSSVCYDEVLKNYKFYLSFENAICADYVTEKFFNIFNYDIVPVVYGAANYSALAPDDSFIDATQFPTPKVLAKTLIRIANSDKLYKEMLTRKMSFKAYLDPWMCKLCNKLHDSVTKSVVTSVEKWIFQDSPCKRWDEVNENFVNI